MPWPPTCLASAGTTSYKGGQLHPRARSGLPRRTGALGLGQRGLPKVQGGVSLASPDLEKPGEPSPQVQVGWGFRGGAETLLVHGGAGRQGGAGPPRIHGEAGSQGWGLFTGRGGASPVTEGWGLTGPKPGWVGLGLPLLPRRLWLQSSLQGQPRYIGSILCGWSPPAARSQPRAWRLTSFVFCFLTRASSLQDPFVLLRATRRQRMRCPGPRLLETS